MADLPTFRSGHEARFTHRVRGKVVVQHEMVLVGPFKRIDQRRIAQRAERGGNDGLGFTAGEKC